MRRREFITLLGGTVACWSLAARAQHGRLPVVGVLRPSAKDAEPFVEPFRRYMKAIGWEEGRNIRFLFAWMEGHNERAPLLASDFVAQNVDLIVTFGDPAIRAAQRATQTIPIVGMTDDMVGSGLVAGLARPGEWSQRSHAWLGSRQSNVPARIALRPVVATAGSPVQCDGF